MSLNPLRVCHLGKYYPPAPGGIETHVRTLAMAQAEQGVEVRVLCVNHLPGPTAVERDGPIEVIRCGRRASAAKLDVCPDLPRRLSEIEAKTDVFHMQAPNPTMVLALLRAVPRIPLVVSYQSDVIRQRFRALLFRPIERLVYRRVSAILPSSPNYTEGSRFLRSYADRLQVLPNGIELRPYLEPSPEHIAESIRVRERYSRNEPLWLACGRQVYYKGFIHAIRALTRVPGRLLLIGDGPDRAILQAEVKKLGLKDRAIFIGNLPHYHDLVPYYLAATAFWFPSNARSEAFGLVQVEAMASGCPVINAAIPHSGVPWVSLHERTGLTVPINDPIALADAASRLLTEPGLRDRLSAAAKERAVREFDHRRMAERTLEIYRRILGDRSEQAGRSVRLLAPTS